MSARDQGKFHVFRFSRRNLFAFASAEAAEKALVLVPGLGDRPFSLPYAPRLRAFCDERGAALVHFQMRSLPHYGIHTVGEDVEDIGDLHAAISGAYKEITFLGHSTGCQDLLLYAETLGPEEKEKVRFVLQGPVSDREHEKAVNPELAALVQAARKEDPARVLHFRHAGEYITAGRFLDLFQVQGKEDLFSLDLHEPYVGRNRHRLPLHFVISEKDEYLKADPRALKKRLEAYPGALSVSIIEGADHGLSVGEEEFIQILGRII